MKSPYHNRSAEITGSTLSFVTLAMKNVEVRNSSADCLVSDVPVSPFSSEKAIVADSTNLSFL